MESIYMTKNQFKEQYGTYYQISTGQALDLNSVKSFCKLFEDEKRLIKICELPMDSSFDENSSEMSLDKDQVIEKFIEKMKENLKSILESRKEKLNNYHNGPLIDRVKFFVANKLASEENKDDVEYIEKGIEFLSSRIDELEKRFHFFVEKYIEDLDEKECVNVPQELDNLLKTESLYLAITDENKYPAGIYTLNVIDIKKYLNSSNSMNIVFNTEVEEHESMQVTLSLMNNNYCFNNKNTYHFIFQTKQEACEKLLSDIKQKEAVLNERKNEIIYLLNKEKLKGDGLNIATLLEVKG